MLNNMNDWVFKTDGVNAWYEPINSPDYNQIACDIQRRAYQHMMFPFGGPIVDNWPFGYVSSEYEAWKANADLQATRK